jgi:hypothetical protein
MVAFAWWTRATPFQHVSTFAQGVENAVLICFGPEIIRFARNTFISSLSFGKEYPAIEQERHAFCDVLNFSQGRPQESAALLSQRS